MRWITGTAKATGQIIGTRPDTPVSSIEFHAKAANTAEATVGNSTVSLSDGMGLEPDDRHSPDFTPGTVLLKDIYVAVAGGDKVDWSAQVTH